MQRVAISFGLAVLSLLTSYAIAAKWPDGADRLGASVLDAAKPPVMAGLAD
jgi:hypothetical protein